MASGHSDENRIRQLSTSLRLSRRSRRTFARDVASYLYEGDQLIGEYGYRGALIRRYVRGPGEDEPFVIYEGPGTTAKSWLYADHQGSVTASADASGNPISAMSYGPFGEPNATTGIELRYTGQMLDPDTGLYYYKARWYSPWMGRFLSPDPIGIDDGMHLYTYVGNDPVNYRDPDGRLKQIAGRWWQKGKPWLEWAPIIGDGIAFHDAWNDPSLINIAAAGLGLVPGVGDAAGKALKNGDEIADFAKGLDNPFKGKSPEEIDEMFKSKGFDPRGPDPVSGKGGYVNPETGRSYHIDPANSYGEPPHVDVNRPKGYQGSLPKKKYPMGN